MNYEKYRFNAREIAVYTCLYIVVDMAISYLFYDSLIAAVIIMAGFVFYLRIVKKLLIEKRQDRLREQFIRATESVVVALNAGFSPENAFAEAALDMEKIYGKRGLIVRELDLINSKVNVGEKLTEILNNLADRSALEEIRDFAVVFDVAARNGSSFSRVITGCVEMMKMRIETEREIEVMISGKKYEHRIMCFIPPIIIAYLKFTSSGFLSVLYHNVAGIVGMSIALIVYVSAVILGEKMCNIKV